MFNNFSPENRAIVEKYGTAGQATYDKAHALYMLDK
jgi:hypothetical protein